MIMSINREVYNPNLTKIKPAHTELYKRMKLRNDEGAQFTKDDLLEIYSRFVNPEKRKFDYDRSRLTDEQIYGNASAWMNKAIVALIRRGYFRLVFLKPVDSMVMEEGVQVNRGED